MNRHREIGYASLVSRTQIDRARRDFHQLRLHQPGAVIAQIAQQFGHTFIGLRSALQRDGLVLLFHVREIDAVGQLTHQLVEQMNREVAVALKVFHRLLPRTQSRDLGLQGRNFFDLGFELLYLGLQKGVLGLLA